MVVEKEWLNWGAVCRGDEEEHTVDGGTHNPQRCRLTWQMECKKGYTWEGGKQRERAGLVDSDFKLLTLIFRHVEFKLFKPRMTIKSIHTHLHFF